MTYAAHSSHRAAPMRRRGRALGDTATTGPDALALAADAVLAGLPAGSGVNPITPAMEAAKGSSQVVDTQWGGYRNVPYYNANPIADPSGLILWTGSDSCQPPAGLSAAQLLAMQVLLAHGDKSWSADYFPKNSLQYTSPVNNAPNAVVSNYAVPIPTVIPPPPPVVPQYTQDQITQYQVTHGGFSPPDGTTIAPATATGALDAVASAGGDPTKWTNVIDANTGAAVATVKRDGNGDVLMQPGGAQTDLSAVVNTVTGWIDHAAGTITNIGAEVQHVGNAITGAAAGAQVGYSAPLNWKPWAMGAGALALAVLLSTGSKRR